MTLESRPTENFSDTYSVVIPAWNEAALISSTVDRVLQAMGSQRYQGNLIVVDNNSTDDTASIASRSGAQVVFEPYNQIATARNTGARASDASWLIFVDADTFINAALLTVVLDALASGEVIGGGSTIVPDRVTSRFGSTVLKFWNWVSVKSRTAAGCFIYCRADAFEEVNGFDTKVYAGEELHLSRRLRKLAKQRSLRFVIQTEFPVITSFRKLEWFTAGQMVRQFLILLLPFASYSKRLCGVWYDRSKVRKK